MTILELKKERIMNDIDHVKMAMKSIRAFSVDSQEGKDLIDECLGKLSDIWDYIDNVIPLEEAHTVR
jgi:hypothetical protein